MSFPAGRDCPLTPLNDRESSTSDSLLAALHDAFRTEPTPAPDADYFHLKNRLTATGLLDATTVDGTGIGMSSLSPKGAAHVALATDKHLIADHAESTALEARPTRMRNGTGAVAAYSMVVHHHVKQGRGLATCYESSGTSISVVITSAVIAVR